MKEAYEVLRDPVKRKQYDLRFDNFSYRKEVALTPQELLFKLRAIRERSGKSDPHRMDLDRLEFEITELLSERNTQMLAQASEQEFAQQFIKEMLDTARPLRPPQLWRLVTLVLPLAVPPTDQQIQAFLKDHIWNNRWHQYKIFFAIAAAVLLCLLIYLFSK